MIASQIQALLQAKQYVQALALCQNALASSPEALTNVPSQPVASLDQLNLHYYEALIFHLLDKYTQAIDAYERFLKKLPSHEKSRYHLGLCYQAIGDHTRALSTLAPLLLNETLSHEISKASLHINLGASFLALGQITQALQHDTYAIELTPHDPMALAAYGFVLALQGQFQGALDAYERALAHEPDHAIATLNQALTFLLLGQWERAWPDYEARWRTGHLPVQHVPAPRLLSLPSLPSLDTESTSHSVHPLSGRTILIYAEQGLGDTWQFCRFLPLLQQTGAQVIVRVQAEAVPLLNEGLKPLPNQGSKTLWPLDIKPLDAPCPMPDWHCPLLSLPHFFKTQVDTVPLPQGYLQPSPTQVQTWAQRLGEKKAPRIGLVWRGNALHPRDAWRSLPFDLLLSYLPKVLQYVCLQKEVSDLEYWALKQAGVYVHEPHLLTTWSDTAALCALMDVVISVDTAVAHLSGALGQTTWILLPAIPDWRWLLERTDTPWYAHARLYRQTKVGLSDWSSVLEKVRTDLQQLGNKSTQ